jgi:tRNA A-37 threonylcarbamoyl transferase component Bud32
MPPDLCPYCGKPAHGRESNFDCPGQSDGKTDPGRSPNLGSPPVGRPDSVPSPLSDFSKIDPSHGTKLSVGTLVGEYQIQDRIGEGGMGTVYEALHVRLNKRVAVKLMAPDLASDDVALARFHREAAVASHLGHPHLVNVSDFGTAASGEPYIVMEYLEGEDLQHRLGREERLPLATAVAMAKQIASALAAAHAEGVVHRDLKPANVFLVRVPDEAEFVKVLDFGVSKIKAARTRLTNSAHLLGTPEFMPPEQATGEDEIDHRADQWALACIVWQMLCGRPPFAGEDFVGVLYQVVNQEPDAAALHAVGLPPAVEPVLRRALAKRMADRFPTIRHFARALELAAGGTESLPATRIATIPLGVPATGARGGGVAAHPASARVTAGAAADDRPRRTWLVDRFGSRGGRRFCAVCGFLALSGALLLVWGFHGRRSATAGVVTSQPVVATPGLARPAPESAVAPHPLLDHGSPVATPPRVAAPAHPAARAAVPARGSKTAHGRLRPHAAPPAFVNPRPRHPIIDEL